MRVLTRYTQSKDITNIENISQTEYLQNLALDAKNATPPDDYYNPYSYDQWYNRNLGIVSGQEHQQYESYLKSWYQNRYTPTTITSDLKDDYIAFLKDLTLVLNKEDKTNWLVDINWDDPLEVEQAIPFFAKKLREIAIYLVNKRDALKKAKLKYNTSGANQAIERLFYEYLLKAFTKRNYVMNVPEEATYNMFSDLSAINNGFKIIVEELYDDYSYMDKDPSLSASQYFTVTSPDITAYYDSLSIAPSAYEWLFSTGFTQLCANNPLYWIVGNLVTSELPLSAFVASDNLILNEYYKFKMAQKYLGENQYYVSGGYYIPWEKEYVYDLIAGNNWWYWPSGEFINEVETATLDPLRLVSSKLIENGATGAKNYLSADKIFVKYDNVVSGAWLKSVVQTTEVATMCANIIEGINSFRYPFPGFGLSGEGLDWSGKQLSNLDNNYQFLPQETQQAVADLYWTTNTTTSSICAVLLNNTQLVDNGAIAGRLYNEADHISIRTTDAVDKIHDSTPDNIYQGGMQHAWLYKFETTDIPIGRQQNYIHWPIYRYNSNDTNLMNILTSQCAPMALSSLPTNAFIGARSGYGLYDSDIIYKLDTRNGTPIECAFLSGQTLDGVGGVTATFTSAATGAIQTALCLDCKAGQATTFIWAGDDMDINDTFIKNVRHQPDCAYLFLDHHSLYIENPADRKPNIDYRQWQQCDCRAITYSPLGHPGSLYDDYRGMADVIYLDTLYPIPFVTNLWVGLDGEDYLHSEDFAWFKLNGPDVEPDVGWGAGQWVAGGIPTSTRKFRLKKGQQYKYLRASMGHDSTYLTDGSVPYMIIKQPYTNVPAPQWIRAIINESGDWVIDKDANGNANPIPSDMILQPGDYLVYDHIDSNWYCITSLGNLGEGAATYTPSAINTGSVWQNYNFVTTGTQIDFTWPSILHEGVSNAPDVLAFQLSGIIWSITSPNNQTSAYLMTPNETMSIVPNIVGNWTVNVTGMKVVNIGNNYFVGEMDVKYNNVGNFTVASMLSVVELSGSYNIETIYADTINTTINTPLYGWNYTTNNYDGVSNGARPFWADASDKNNRTTKHKGVDIWGGGIRIVDDYTLLTQPESANIELGLDTYIEYTTNGNFVWIEPLTLNVNVTANNWKELIIDTTRIASLSDFLYNINQELVVSGTDRPSEIVLLAKVNEMPVFVNYWAVNPFQWMEILTNSSLGLPPTGGILIPIATGELVEALFPYVNLSNRHFPTIATVPHVEELYSAEDSGAYFVPRMLGISTALTKNLVNKFNGFKIPNNGPLSGAFVAVTTPENYTQDRGFSENDQNIATENDQINSLWMKSPITSWQKAGIIVDAAKHQQFIPYKTKYENYNFNTVGVQQQDDPYDPWFGEFDSEWENPTDWPPDFRKQYNIPNWYSQFGTQGKQIYQWKSDIFNNQYALFKANLSAYTNYEKKHEVAGDVWVRNSRNIIAPISAVISDIDMSNINNILDIDIFYDTLMFYTSTYLFYYKLDMDYEDGTITTDSGSNVEITLSANQKFGGTWLTDDKMLTIGTLVSTVDQIYPVLYSLNLNTNRLTNRYDVTGTELDMSSYNLTSIDNPVFTYDKIHNIYNISYLAYGIDKSGMYLTTINLVNSNDQYVIESAKTVVPQS